MSSTFATFSRSCSEAASLAIRRTSEQPAGNLVLDDDDRTERYEYEGEFPATYYRLAADERAKFGYKPTGWDSWGQNNASRYIRKFQSRRSLLVWKILGERTRWILERRSSVRIAARGRGSRASRCSDRHGEEPRQVRRRLRREHYATSSSHCRNSQRTRWKTGESGPLIR